LLDSLPLLFVLVLFVFPSFSSLLSSSLDLCNSSFHFSVMAKKQAAAKKVTTTTTTTTTTHKSSRGGKKTASSSSWKRTLYRYSAFLVGVAIAVSYGFVKSIVTDLGLFLGTVVPFNTEGCEPLVGLETCEDIHIHHPWGLAFTTCGHAESRKGWYPPIGNNNASAENAFKDKFVLYSLEVSIVY